MRRLTLFLCLLMPSLASAQPSEVIHGASCRVVVADANGGGNSLGSGTLVGRNEQCGIVVTVGHVVKDGDRVTCSFPGGQSFQGRVIAIHPTDDAAVVQITPRPNIQPIAMSDTEPSGRVSICGYGPNGVYREVSGDVINRQNAVGMKHPSIVVSAEVRQGDSGGGVFDSEGRFCGAVWGCCHSPDDNDSRVTSMVAIGESLEASGVLRGRQPSSIVSLTQCYGGSCNSGGCSNGNCQIYYSQPAYRIQPSAPAIQPINPPITPPKPTQPIASIPGPQGERGEKGERGEQGPPGPGSTCACGPKWTSLEAELVLLRQEVAAAKAKPSTVNFVNADGKVVATATVTPGATSSVTLPPINFRVQDHRGAAFSTEYQPAQLGSYVTLPFGPAK